MDVLETLKRIGGYYHFRGPTGRQRKNEYLACKVGIDRFVASALQYNLKNPIEKEEWQEEGYQ